MNKFTPGPWHCHPDQSFYIFADGADPEHGRFIANCSTQANMLLIAAAPDLLVALANLCGSVENKIAELNLNDDKTLDDAGLLESLQDAVRAIDKAIGGDKCRWE